MKKFLAVMMSALLLSCCFASCSSDNNTVESTPVDINDFRVTSYIAINGVTSTNEQSYSEDSLDIITDVIFVGGVSFDSNATLDIDDEAITLCMDDLTEKIEGKDVNVFVSLTGPQADISIKDEEEQAKDIASRYNEAFKSDGFIQSIIDLLDTYGFDGVYFDYENPVTASNWKKYSKFLVELDSSLGDKILGVALSPEYLDLTDDAKQAVDRVEMTLYNIYDKYGNHSSVEYSEELSQNFINAGYDKAKLDFGIPFFGKSVDESSQSLSYSAYAEMIDDNGWAYVDDFRVGFYFNTPEQVYDKTIYAVENGFGGVMCWNYTGDLSVKSENSLLASINSAINESKQG